MTAELMTFLLAMTPVGELRLAIPVALSSYGLSWPIAYIISVLGNLVPVLFFLLFLDPVSQWLSAHFKIFDNFFSWLFARTRKRHGDKIEKYGYPGLVLVVAIPLPITGAWTGTLVAFLFGIEFKKAFSSITIGVLIAGAIVTSLTKTGIAVEKYFGYEVLIGLVAFGILVWFLYNKIRSIKS
ncbi:MAG: small multi-drug export protein [Candidatus Paceibacterota bacterium]